LAPVHTLMSKLWFTLPKWVILTQNYVFWERFFHIFQWKHKGLPIFGHPNGQNSYGKVGFDWEAVSSRANTVKYVYSEKCMLFHINPTLLLGENIWIWPITNITCPFAPMFYWAWPMYICMQIDKTLFARSFKINIIGSLLG
jgi:hypothetical protein